MELEFLTIFLQETRRLVASIYVQYFSIGFVPNKDSRDSLKRAFMEKRIIVRHLRLNIDSMIKL